MPVEPGLDVRMTQGQSDEFGEVQHRQIIFFSGFLGDAFLGDIQVGLTHLARDDKTFRPGLQGPVIELLHQSIDDIRPGNGKTGPATVGFVRPGIRVGA